MREPNGEFSRNRAQISLTGPTRPNERWVIEFLPPAFPPHIRRHIAFFFLLPSPFATTFSTTRMAKDTQHSSRFHFQLETTDLYPLSTSFPTFSFFFFYFIRVSDVFSYFIFGLARECKTKAILCGMQNTPTSSSSSST